MEQRNLTGYPSIDKPWLKYYSEEAISAELPSISAFEYLETATKDFKYDTAIEYYGKRYTFVQILDCIHDAIKAFNVLGVRRGDIVTICSPMLPEVIFAFYALNALGAVANMIDPRLSVAGIHDSINEVGSNLLVFVDVCYPKLTDIVQKTTIQTAVFIPVSNSMPAGMKVLYHLKYSKKQERISTNGCYLSWQAFVSRGKKADSPKESRQEGSLVAAMERTGGTTGTPKAVVLSNANINSIAFQYSLSIMGLKRGQRLLNIMPPFITYGLSVGMHMPLCNGLSLIIIPKFSPNEFDALIKKHQPNMLLGVPIYFSSLLKSDILKSMDLSFIQGLGVGGDNMDISVEKQVNAFFEAHGSSARVEKGYGMTELCATVSVCQGIANQLGSVGIPLVKNVISIFDIDTGEELKYCKKGEICVNGPSMMLHYYEDTQESQCIIRKHNDGLFWIHTGDVGYMTEDGLLYVIDRIKRMIIRSGWKVFPSLIESIISSHNAVLECAVVGATNSAGEKIPVAYIVLKKDCLDRTVPIMQEIKHLCKERLVEYAVPEYYHVYEKLPLTLVGKIDYRTLEEMAAAQTGGQA